MRNLFKFMVFGMLTFSKVEGCHECYRSLEALVHMADEEYENWIKENPRATFEEHAWVIGVRENTKRGIRMSAQMIAVIHPELKLTEKEWENLKAPKRND